MRYIQRKNGKVVAHFANEQSYARELAPNNHPDILEFTENRKDKRPRVSQQLITLEDRIKELEEMIKKLTGSTIA